MPTACSARTAAAQTTDMNAMSFSVRALSSVNGESPPFTVFMMRSRRYVTAANEQKLTAPYPMRMMSSARPISKISVPSDAANTQTDTTHTAATHMQNASASSSTVCPYPHIFLSFVSSVLSVMNPFPTAV